MTIDYISDVHFDFYFPRHETTSEEELVSFFNAIFHKKDDEAPGDVLVIAGDLGHNNLQNIKMLQIISKHFYKRIVCVLGNHDYYLSDSEDRKKYELNSMNRINEMRDLINKEEGMDCLNGNVVEIEGVRFGGCDGWYSDAYIKANFPLRDAYKSSPNELWRQSMSDSTCILGIKRFDDIYALELPKIEHVYKKCDVMITHVNPSFLKEHTAPAYRESVYTTFFTFDGHRFMDQSSMKYWIFGHTHDRIEYEFHGVKCLCNPLGYPYENADFRIRSFEV